MNDINSLPLVPQHQIDAMQREAERKFGKVPGLDESPVQPQMNPMIQNHPDPVYEEQDGPEAQAIPEQEAESTRTKQESEQESDRAHNFRAIREKAKQAERERDEALKIVRELQARTDQATTPKEMYEENDTFGINPDDLVEGKHLSKVAKEMKALREQLKGYQQQSNLTATEARLKAQFPDFDKVLSPDNIETFRYAYPELASTIDSTPDIYTKAVSAYTMIKKFGVHQEAGSSTEKEISKKNLAKPRPMASVAPQQGDSPISRANAFANGLTKDLQAQMWKEINDARKGY
jgi:hypothetical protein